MGRFNFDLEKFKKVRDKAEEMYQTFNSVYCPYFKEKISFNVKGLRHLKFKSDQQARTQEEQYPRLKLLYLAPQVLNKSYTIQGIWRTRQFEPHKTSGKWKYIAKDVSFYEFIAVLDEVRVKIIVKEVFGGEKYFWSIIPYWNINRLGQKRILHTGNPNSD